MTETGAKQVSKVQQFWNAFQACVEENRVGPDRSVFYVRWAQEFVRFEPGKRLRDRTRQDVEAFLADLRERPGVSDWRARQAEHALKILYEIFIPGYAPKGTTTPAQGSEKEIPTEETGPATIGLRDRVIPGEVERLFSPLLDAARKEIRSRHYSIRTETAYIDWARRFIAFHGYADPQGLEATSAVREYLDYLAMERKVAASTQNQALNALVFFYGQALRKPVGEVEAFVRAKRPQRLPEVMTRDEVEALFAQMEGVTALMAGLMYGGGLRLMECVRLRVMDLDFARHQIMVRDGKGQKDRITMLSVRFAAPLQEHLAQVKALFEEDRAKGVPGVYIWPAMARKYPRATAEWKWQYVFPAKSLSVDPRSGTVRRHHLNEGLVQKAVKEAADGAGLNRRISCHTLRHNAESPIMPSSLSRLGNLGLCGLSYSA
jgi:integron integrase